MRDIFSTCLFVIAGTHVRGERLDMIFPEWGVTLHFKPNHVFDPEGMAVHYLEGGLNLDFWFQPFGGAVSVFGQAKELNGIVGKSIEFRTPVQTSGSLSHKGVIGDVTSSHFTIRSNEYEGRLQWDSRSGHFTLSGIKEIDAGEYKVQNTEPKIITVYQLKVYIPVSKPNVGITRNEYPCQIMCTVDRGTEVTLSWYREGEKEHLSRSLPLDAASLSLPQTVVGGDTYTCVANNSVSNLNTSITVGEHCTGSNIGLVAGGIIGGIIFGIILGVITQRVLGKKGCCRAGNCKQENQSKSSTEQRGEGESERLNKD